MSGLVQTRLDSAENTPSKGEPYVISTVTFLNRNIVSILRVEEIHTVMGFYGESEQLMLTSLAVDINCWQCWHQQEDTRINRSLEQVMH